MANARPPDAILTEVLPREAARLGRGVARMVVLMVGVLFAIDATILAMFFVANGMPTLAVFKAVAIVSLIFAVFGLVVVSIFYLVSLRYLNQLLPRSTTIAGDQVLMTWPRGSVSYRLADCKWSAGRSSWEWLGIYLHSHPTTLFIAPTRFVYLLGTDQASAAHHAAVLSDLGVEQVNYVSPTQRVFRRARAG